MKFERTITVGQTPVTVVLSDEMQTLLAAKAAGRVAVGLERPGSPAELSCAEYVYVPDEGAEFPEDAWLERIARRALGIPWEIARTERLVIRELAETDLERLPEEPEDGPGELLLRSRSAFSAYIRSQYRFYGCGIWAVERREDGVLVGLAGVASTESAAALNEEESPALELGYHIFGAYRRQGYAKEACLAVLSWVKEEYGGQAVVFACTQPENTASGQLLKRLGFVREPAKKGQTSGRKEHWRLFKIPEEPGPDDPCGR